MTHECLLNNYPQNIHFLFLMQQFFNLHYFLIFHSFDTPNFYSFSLIHSVLLWPLYPMLVIISFSLAAVMLYMYIRLLTNDPGACQTSRNSNSHLEEYTTVDHIAKGQCDIIDFCVTCEVSYICSGFQAWLSFHLRPYSQGPMCNQWFLWDLWGKIKYMTPVFT